MDTRSIIAAVAPIVNEMLKDGPVEVIFTPGTGEPLGRVIDGVELAIGPTWRFLSVAPDQPNGVYVVNIQ